MFFFFFFKSTLGEDFQTPHNYYKPTPLDLPSTTSTHWCAVDQRHVERGKYISFHSPPVTLEERNAYDDFKKTRDRMKKLCALLRIIYDYFSSKMTPKSLILMKAF